MWMATTRRWLPVVVVSIVLGLSAAVPSMLMPAAAQTEPPAVI